MKSTERVLLFIMVSIIVGVMCRTCYLMGLQKRYALKIRYQTLLEVQAVLKNKGINLQLPEQQKQIPTK